MKLRDLGLLFLLAAMWGASFLFIRLAAPALGPTVLVTARVFIAGFALLIYARMIRHDLAVRKHWRKFLLLGALNASIPFTLIATAELELTASFGAILNATTPLFGALIAAVWLKDALTARKIAGLVLGISGVAVAVGWSPIPLNLTVLLSIGASLLGAFFYGLGGVYSKVAFKGTPPLSISIGQALGAGIGLLPLALANPPQSVPPTLVIFSVLMLALPCTALAYLIYFRLIASAGPTSAMSVTFIVPVFGMIWGRIFLDEPIGAGLVTGFAVILAGLLLVTGVRLPLLTAPITTSTQEAKAAH